MTSSILSPLSPRVRLGLVVVGLLGQALGAGSLRAPFLPLAGPTPAPSPSRPLEAADPAAVAAGRATLGSLRAAHPALAPAIDDLLAIAEGRAAPPPAPPR